MKVHEYINQLLELNPDYEIGLADDEHGVVELRGIEVDTASETYRIV